MAGETRMKMKPVLGLLLLTLVAACTRVDIGAQEGDSKTHRYFGFVEVKVPQTRGRVHAVAVTSAGIALEDGLMIGWRENERIVVPVPLEDGKPPPDEAPCNLIVIVRSDEDAKHARDILAGLEGENICLTSFQ